MESFKKGDTPVFKIVPNVPVGDIGEPVCVIWQDGDSFEMDTWVDEDENALYASLEKKDSIRLVGGFPAWIQHVWKDGIGNVMAFPPLEVMVEDVYINLADYEDVIPGFQLVGDDEEEEE